MKKLIFALLAALVLSGCGSENPVGIPDPENSGADSPQERVGSVRFDLDSIPKEAEYFTVCRHRDSGSMYIKSDALLQTYPFEELENYCYYIPRGDEPEIVESAEEGDAFVVDDNGLRLVVFGGGEYDLPFDEYKNRDEYDGVFLKIIRDGTGGSISGVIESAVDSDGGRYKQIFYSTAERKIMWESEYDLG